MSARDEELLRRLLTTFQVEAREHIDAMAAGLVGLERAAAGDAAARVLDSTFRHAHSLKGAARAVNAGDIESVCQALESVFAAMKRERLAPSPELFDLLHRVVDLLTRQLEHLGRGAAAKGRPRTGEILAALQAVLGGATAPAAAPATAPPAREKVAAVATPPGPEVGEPATGAETVRVSTAKLDAVLLQAEEMLLAKQACAQQAAGLREVHRLSAQWRKRWARLSPGLRPGTGAAADGAPQNGRAADESRTERLDEFLEWNRTFVEELEHRLEELTAAAEQNRRSVGAMVDGLLDEMKKVVMQPFSTLLDPFPRMVRELARELGKEVELSIYGREIEIDRRILQEMKDPLIHLIRNGVDHGIELPAERTRQGKPPRGALTIGISPKTGNSIELLVSDDGAGIDVASVKAVAGKARLAPAAEIDALPEAEARLLIFRSGISTSPIITDVSGRGLGLAIVREKVEKLASTIAVESAPGRGTTFRIVLPLTLARFHGVVVRVEESLFVLPSSHVERVLRVKRAAVKTVENRATIALGGETISLVELHRALGLAVKAGTPERPDTLPVIVAAAGRRIAFAVDEILREEEVLVKSLGRQLRRVRNVAGASLLGDGRLALILNVPDLIQSALQAGGPGPAAVPETAPARGERRKTVLVAEDSITSRALLKNILEAAGYAVETGVDGVDALTRLRSGSFDLVVSDVDMPRLNGFGLTAKIRADKRLANLPVVLVTALDSRADREQGIDAGANAYIVKSSFDQGNLLEVIQRLL